MNHLPTPRADAPQPTSPSARSPHPLHAPHPSRRQRRRDHRGGAACALGVAVAAACSAMLPLAAHAQASSAGTVVIQGSRSSGAISPLSLDAEQLQRLRATTADTAALLRELPGLSLQGAGGASSLPMVHGLGGDRLRIKVDGMDLIASCPNHMNPPLSYLDPSAVATLEVFAGIAPVSAGGDSIGGTIVARTRDAQFAAPGEARLVTGELGASVRSNGDAQRLHARATYATETLSLAYTGALAKSGNVRAGDAFKTSTATGRAEHTLALDEVGSTAYETRNHTLTLAHRNGTQLIEARLGLQEVPEQLYPNQRMDMLRNTQQRANLRYLGRHDWGVLEARAWHEDVDHFMDFGADKRFWYGSRSGSGSPCAPIGFAGDPNGTCAAGMPMATASRNSGLSARADIELGAADWLRTGVEAQAYRLDDTWPASGGGMGPGTFENIRDGRRDRSALFGEWESRRVEGWTTSLGVRLEQVRTDAGAVHGYSTASNAPGGQFAEAAAFNARERARTDRNLDLAALARRTLSSTLDVEAGLARKVRSPNLYERYTWSTWAMAATMNNFVGDGNGYVGNPDLRPEVAHTLSATLDWHAADRTWSLRATPYVTRVQDYIDAVKRTGWVAGKFNVLAWANQSARIAGLDLSGRLALPATAWGQWSLEGVASVVDGENRDSGDELYNLMPANVRLTLAHRLGAFSSALEVVGVQAKRKVNDTRNEIATAGYGLLNLRTGVVWKQWRLDAGIENLLDRHHVLPTGGAYLGQGTTMSMNGVPWGVGVPGPGRSLYAGLSMSF